MTNQRLRVVSRWSLARPGMSAHTASQAYAKNVTAAVVRCGHWVAEEIPEVLLGHLLPFLA